MQRDRFAAAGAWLDASAEDAAVARALIAVSFCVSRTTSRGIALKAAAIALADDHQRTHSLRVLIREIKALGEQVPAELRADALNDGDPAEYFDASSAEAALDRATRILAYGRSLVAKAKHGA